MGQKELIEFCKENDPNFNKEASFKILEPMWSIPKGVGGIGITESEFRNGFYVQIDTKGRKGFENLEGKVFYFREKVEPSKYCFQIYNSHWKKFFVPLTGLEMWGKEIIKEDFGVVVKSTETQKGILEQIKEHVLYAQMPSEQLETMKEVFENPVEEFPIQKIQGKTTYRKRDSFIVIGQINNDVLELGLIDSNKETSGFEVAYSKQEFSDLVDLMIEARKDLLK